MDISNIDPALIADGVGTNKGAGVLEFRYGSLIKSANNLVLSANSTGIGFGGKVILHDNLLTSSDFTLGTGSAN